MSHLCSPRATTIKFLGDLPSMTTFIEMEAGLKILPAFANRCWVNVECPDEDDFNFLTQELNIPEEFLSDIADLDERPRTEHEGDWQLTILRIPVESNIQGAPYTTVPIGIITNERATVSVCYKKSQMLPDFINHIRRKSINFESQSDFITRLIYSSAVWFLKYLKIIYLEVTTAEKALESSIRNEDLLRIMRLQKSLVYFSTSIRGNEAMLGRLRTVNRAQIVDPELIEDVVIELRQAYNTVNIYSDIVTGTMDAFASIISNNVNTIMKRMTSLSIVLMVPTLIASFYGMNVDIHIGKIPYAFVGIVLFSLLLSVLAFYIFRKIKWF